MSNADLIRLHNADGVARRNFHYQPDPTDRDRWRSFAADAIIGRDWRGDCDDLASTTLDILSQNISPGPGKDDLLSRMYRLKVKSEVCPRGEPFDHMVAAVKVGFDLWIIGDTFLKAHKVEASPHRLLLVGRIHSHSKVSEGVVWRAGFGDLLKPA